MQDWKLQQLLEHIWWPVDLVASEDCKECLGTNLVHDQSIPELCKRNGASDAAHAVHSRMRVGNAARWSLGWKKF